MPWQDPRTGCILGIGTHQGYGGNSRWARGLAWVLDGMPDAYRVTKDEKYRAQFERSARWFEDNLPEDLISWYDFDDQAVFWRYRDSSTSAICAYGLLRMSELELDRALAARYRDLGTRVVNALIDRCLTPVGTADFASSGNAGVCNLHEAGGRRVYLGQLLAGALAVLADEQGITSMTGSDWNKKLDLKKGPKVWRVAQASGYKQSAAE